MKYRTLIYDEERKETHITKQLVEEYFYPLGSATYIHCMSDPKKLLQSDCLYHLVIITVPVSKASLELLLMHLRGCNPYMYLLFISNDVELYKLGYLHGARNFLLKPLKREELVLESDRFQAYIGETRSYRIEVPTRAGLENVPIKDIIFVQTKEHRRYFRCRNRMVSALRDILSMEDVMAQLPDTFFRCNRSHLVNVDYVVKIQKENREYEVVVETGEHIKLSNSKRKELYNRYSQWKKEVDS